MPRRFKAEERECVGAYGWLLGNMGNAAALFSVHALEAYTRAGLEIESPFVGTKIRDVRLEAYKPLDRKLLEQLWKNPTNCEVVTPMPPAPGIGGKIWKNRISFQQAHPDAYALLLRSRQRNLGLGVQVGKNA